MSVRRDVRRGFQLYGFSEMLRCSLSETLVFITSHLSEGHILFLQGVAENSMVWTEGT